MHFKVNRPLYVYIVSSFIIAYILLDLKNELRILTDHLTFMSLLFALRSHPISLIASVATIFILLRQLKANK